MEMFHGGCKGCTMQDKKGISYCVGCQYFDTDWSLPNLNDSYISEQEKINKVKAEALLLKELGDNQITIK